MHDKKIRVALVYKKSYNFFQPDHFDRTSYDFFFKALKRNKRLEISYYPCEKKFDVSKIKGKCDVILLPNNCTVDYDDGSTDGAPDALIGIKNSNIPVISRTGDPHVAKKYNQIELHEKFKIDCYWSLQPKSYFYKFYPKHFLYKEILWGLEPSLYKNLKSYKSRIKNKILNSGNVGRNDLKSKFGHIFSKDTNSALYFYKLRTMCNKLPYVDYAGMKESKYINENYPEYLSKYCAAIATGTYYPVIKYFEIPAAGCLTFMEMTEKNHAEYLGYKDNETAIFVNEKNYKNKFEEYLNDPNNKKWEEIANSGMDYTINEVNNDKGVESLVELIESFIK